MATNDIQLRRTVGWIDPVDAAALLEGPLLDGMGAHPEARFAFLGLAPALEARLHGRRLDIKRDGQTETREGDPLELIQNLVDAWRWNIDEEHPFTGGFIGYVGYEFARAIEPTLPLAKTDPGTPDAVLQLCMDAAVFDRTKQQVTLYARGDTASANARLDHYAAALCQTVESGTPPPALQWSPSMDEPAFVTAVERVKELIHQGDLFQANIATRFEARTEARALDFFRVFSRGNPSPYMALLRYDDHAIISSSPEQLFAVESGRIRTRPIAGTRPRGDTESGDADHESELLGDEKERAEHTMLVDLLRNDIAKVSIAGTTRVTEAMSVERYQHVMHLVSSVEGTLQDGASFTDCLAALFPGGTITGAPKHRACLRIHEAEPVARGPYTGAAGFLSWSHNAHWNILIRTMVLKDGIATVHAGSGIVADSNPQAEWQEANRKAHSLIRAGGAPRHDAGQVTRHGSWEPPSPSRSVSARVLLVDNYDSFVYNLADYAAACGASVQIMRNDEDFEGVVAAFGPTHVILGPGPGRPEDSRATLIAAAQLDRFPMLGICLGHQAMAHLHGGAVRVVAPVHGKTSLVHHEEPLFGHLTSPFTAARYHSLVVDAPEDWVTSAWLADGTVMAMRHPTLPVWGLQFHPESFATEGGLEIILRFLEA